MLLKTSMFNFFQNKICVERNVLLQSNIAVGANAALGEFQPCKSLTEKHKVETVQRLSFRHGDVSSSRVTKKKNKKTELWEKAKN